MEGSELMSVFKMPVDNHRLTSSYNLNRKHPQTGKVQKHAGVDLVSTKVANAPILATADGVVRLINNTVKKVNGKETGYGKYMIVTHSINGVKYESLYAHLHSFKVKQGQNVKQGQEIALMGTTGGSTGIHLHFEIHKGTHSYDGGNYPNSVDPWPLITATKEEPKKDVVKKEVKDMELSNNGLEFIKKHEGHYLYWYDLDDGGLTTGYGHYVPYADAKKIGIKKNDKITQKQADDFLRADMKKFESGVNKQLKEYGHVVNQNQFDALVSYAFNRGLGKSDGSNGLRQLLKNSKNVSEISRNITVYWGTNQQYKNGLMNRRKAEQVLFNSKVNDKAVIANKEFHEKEIDELKTSNEIMKKRLIDRYASASTHAMIDDAAIKLLGDSKSKLEGGKMNDGDFVANSAEVAVAAIKKLKANNLY